MITTVSGQFLRGALMPALAATGCLFAFGCHREVRTTLRTDLVELPVPPGSTVPQTTGTSTGDIILSWLESRTEKGYRFRTAVRHADQ